MCANNYSKLCVVKEAQVKYVICQEVKLYPLGWFSSTLWISHWPLTSLVPGSYLHSGLQMREFQTLGVHIQVKDLESCFMLVVLLIEQQLGLVHFLYLIKKEDIVGNNLFFCLFVFGILYLISKLLKLTFSIFEVNHSATLVVGASLANKHVTTNADIHSPDCQNSLGTI